MSAEENQALAREFSTKTRTLKAVPYSAKIIEVSPIQKGRGIELDVKELRFLHHLKPYFQELEEGELTYEQAIEMAAVKAGVEKGWAKRYLASKKYETWTQDRMEEAAIRMGVTVEYLIKKHHENVEGTTKLKMSQLQSLQELGERIWPKTQRIEHQVEAKDSRGMDEMMRVRKEVEDLEAKLKEAIEKRADE